MRSRDSQSVAIADSEQQNNELKKPVYNLWYTPLMISAWYSSNIGILLLNKYFLSNSGFRFPIFLTFCHMVMCSIMSYGISQTGKVPHQSIRSQGQLFKIAVLACFFCASVVGGNVSLKFIPVSFNQAIGATTPIFTAICSFLLLYKVETLQTYMTLLPVVVGIVIASNAEPSFHLFGFVVCILSTAMRALKSVLQGMLLSNDNEKLSSMNLLLYMAPISAILLFPAWLLMEPAVFGVVLDKLRNDRLFVLLLVINSFMAYFVNLTNFLVTHCTSPLTLQVLGNGKGVVAVVVSILLFKNPVTAIGMVGYGITVCGVVLYGEAKKRGGKARL